MNVAILADSRQKNEMTDWRWASGVELIWADSLEVLRMLSDIDVYFDMEFRMDTERNSIVKKLAPKPVFVNAVVATTKEIGDHVIRINGWPGFLARPIVELAAGDGKKDEVRNIMGNLGLEYRMVGDLPGMVTPRIIAALVNEAFHTFEAGVSSKEEIDIAMKLGTNYPFGPFEWAGKIGLDNILALLEKLVRADGKSEISALLRSETYSEKPL
ncbi:MAG: hypothetical protein H7Y27_00510 [Gemmatimonadaceae bacterium]|nr:hypothetical protein [Chitinophagaceae bacterium]